MYTAKKHVTSLLLVGLFVFVMIVGIGCKKKSSSTTPTMDDTTKKADSMAKDMQEAATEAAKSMEQTTCPVMDGNPINKNIFVEYKGQKVYFCCPSCKGEFEKDPEKYIAKLPQFK